MWVCAFLFKMEKEQNADTLDHYAVLGVPRDASSKDIRKAYLRLARDRHPDKPGGSEAAFVRIAAAYDVLSSPEKRREYDILLQQRANPQGMPSFFGVNDGGDDGFASILRSLFQKFTENHSASRADQASDDGVQWGFFRSPPEGGGDHGVFWRTAADGRTAPHVGVRAIHTQVQVTLEQAQLGTTLSLEINRRSLDFTRNSPGAATKESAGDEGDNTESDVPSIEVDACLQCAGDGYIRHDAPDSDSSRPTDPFQWRANSPQYKLCSACRGRGFLEPLLATSQMHVLQVQIPAGCPHKFRATFQNAGHQFVRRAPEPTPCPSASDSSAKRQDDNGPPRLRLILQRGPVHVIVHLLPHPVYVADARFYPHLVCVQQLSVEQALRGVVLTLPSLDSPNPSAHPEATSTNQSSPTITVRSPPGELLLRPGCMMTAFGLGRVAHGKVRGTTLLRGNLHVRFEIQFPKSWHKSHLEAAWGAASQESGDHMGTSEDIEYALRRALESRGRDPCSIDRCPKAVRTRMDSHRPAAYVTLVPFSRRHAQASSLHPFPIQPGRGKQSRL